MAFAELANASGKDRTFSRCALVVSAPAFGRTLVAAAALPPPRDYCAAPPKFCVTSTLPLPLPQHT
jgi:hypothetical protein